jgi:putative membrane protein
MKPLRLKESEVSIKQSESDLDTEQSSQSRAFSSPSNETPLNIEKRSSLVSLGFVLLGLLVGLQIVDSLIAAFEVHHVFGWGLLSVIGIVLLFLGRQIAYEYSKLNKQKQLEDIKSTLNSCNRASSHGVALPLIKRMHEQRFSLSERQFVRYLSRVAICQDDSEILYLYSKEVLSDKDELAKALVIRHSSDCALMVAVSPFAAIDMGLVLWRNLKMLNDIGQIYGMPNSPFSRVKVLKQVLKNMMLVGAQELLMDATFESMGVSLGSKLSVRAAQGVGAGLISLRIGLKAIEHCRPIFFTPEEQPKISHLRSDIIAQVKDRLLQLNSSK